MSRRRDIIILGANGPEEKQGSPDEVPWPDDTSKWAGVAYDDETISDEDASLAAWAAYDALN